MVVEGATWDEVVVVELVSVAWCDEQVAGLANVEIGWWVLDEEVWQVVMVVTVDVDIVDAVAMPVVMMVRSWGVVNDTFLCCWHFEMNEK